MISYVEKSLEVSMVRDTWGQQERQYAKTLPDMGCGSEPHVILDISTYLMGDSDLIIRRNVVGLEESYDRATG